MKKIVERKRERTKQRHGVDFWLCPSGIAVSRKLAQTAASRSILARGHSAQDATNLGYGGGNIRRGIVSTVKISPNANIKLRHVQDCPMSPNANKKMQHVKKARPMNPSKTIFDLSPLQLSASAPRQ